MNKYTQIDTNFKIDLKTKKKQHTYTEFKRKGNEIYHQE